MMKATRILTAAILLVLVCGLSSTVVHAQTAPTNIAPPAADTAGDAAANSSADVEPVTKQTPIPTRNMLSIINDGGELMIPLIICSFILMVVVFERIISLARRRIIPRPFVKRFLAQVDEGQIDREEAIELCEANGSAIAKVFAAAASKWGRSSVEMEQAIIDAGERVTNRLRKNLRVINGVATVSPLLGLLGTVVGMIRAFNAIATSEAMGRPELLAGGISQALLTTAAGLSVAIPALIFYMFFTSKVDRLVVEIDARSQQLVGHISAEAIEQRASASKSRRKKAA